MPRKQSVSKGVHNQRSESSQKIAKRSRLGLLSLCIFVGLGALFGGVMAFIAPEFLGEPLLVPVLQTIPLVGPSITSLAIPALSLLLFVFLPHTVAVILLLKQSPQQFRGAIVCGLFLIVFTLGEMVFMPNPASVLFLIFGVIEIVLATISAKAST